MSPNKTNNPPYKQQISLAKRFTRVGIATITILFLILGVCLWSLFEHSAKQGLSSYLSAITNTLIASTLQDENTNIISLADTTKSLNYLPYYWQVTSEGNPISKSPNLAQYHLVTPTKDGTTDWVSFISQENITIHAIKRTVVFPGNIEVTYVFGINQEQASYFIDQQRSQFLPMLILTLVGLTALLITLTTWQIKVSMQPFGTLRQAIAKVKSGEWNTLPGSFPLEIQPLTTEINNLIDHNQGILERYRQFASNLSHALKTPLTILRNEAAAPHDLVTFQSLVTSKSEHMSKLIERYLSRARISGTSHLFSAAINIAPILTSICKNFEKLYTCNVTLSCDNTVDLVIDTEDAYELFGNLIENACKYGGGKVHVGIEQHDNMLVIAIDDNGSGINLPQRKDVLKRGIRLDEQHTGSGIGIPIAVDIAKLYGATLALNESTLLGGLNVIVAFKYDATTSISQ